MKNLLITDASDDDKTGGFVYDNGLVVTPKYLLCALQNISYSNSDDIAAEKKIQASLGSNYPDTLIKNTYDAFVNDLISSYETYLDNSSSIENSKYIMASMLLQYNRAILLSIIFLNENNKLTTDQNLISRLNSNDIDDLRMHLIKILSEYTLANIVSQVISPDVGILKGMTIDNYTYDNIPLRLSNSTNYYINTLEDNQLNYLISSLNNSEEFSYTEKTADYANSNNETTSTTESSPLTTIRNLSSYYSFETCAQLLAPSNNMTIAASSTSNSLSNIIMGIGPLLNYSEAATADDDSFDSNKTAYAIPLASITKIYDIVHDNLRTCSNTSTNKKTYGTCFIADLLSDKIDIPALCNKTALAGTITGANGTLRRGGSIYDTYNTLTVYNDLTAEEFCNNGSTFNICNKYTSSNGVESMSYSGTFALYYSHVKRALKSYVLNNDPYKTTEFYAGNNANTETYYGHKGEVPTDAHSIIWYERPANYEYLKYFMPFIVTVSYDKTQDIFTLNISISKTVNVKEIYYDIDSHLIDSIDSLDPNKSFTTGYSVYSADGSSSTTTSNNLVTLSDDENNSGYYKVFSATTSLTDFYLANFNNTINPGNTIYFRLNNYFDDSSYNALYVNDGSLAGYMYGICNRDVVSSGGYYQTTNPNDAEYSYLASDKDLYAKTLNFSINYDFLINSLFWSARGGINFANMIMSDEYNLKHDIALSKTSTAYKDIYRRAITYYLTNMSTYVSTTGSNPSFIDGISAENLNTELANYPLSTTGFNIADLANTTSDASYDPFIAKFNELKNKMSTLLFDGLNPDSYSDEIKQYFYNKPKNYIYYESVTSRPIINFLDSDSYNNFIKTLFNSSSNITANDYTACFTKDVSGNGLIKIINDALTNNNTFDILNTYINILIFLNIGYNINDSYAKSILQASSSTNTILSLNLLFIMCNRLFSKNDNFGLYFTIYNKSSNYSDESNKQYKNRIHNFGDYLIKSFSSVSLIDTWSSIYPDNGYYKFYTYNNGEYKTYSTNSLGFSNASILSSYDIFGIHLVNKIHASLYGLSLYSIYYNDYRRLLAYTNSSYINNIRYLFTNMWNNEK